MMNIEFREHDGVTVAQNPRIERYGSQRLIKLNEKNCDYFLIFAKTPGGCVDLSDPSVQQAVLKYQDMFPDISEVKLSDGVTLSCVDEPDYKVNNYGGDSICIPDKIAEYTVVGCREENDTVIICVPDEGVSCTARVSLTVTYRINIISGEEEHRMFGKSIQTQPFYVVEFDDISNYPDGGIVFTFDECEYEYPLTAEMISQDKFFIDAGRGKPVFLSKIAGLDIQQA